MCFLISLWSWTTLVHLDQINQKNGQGTWGKESSLIFPMCLYSSSTLSWGHCFGSRLDTRFHRIRFCPLWSLDLTLTVSFPDEKQASSCCGWCLIATQSVTCHHLQRLLVTPVAYMPSSGLCLFVLPIQFSYCFFAPPCYQWLLAHEYISQTIPYWTMENIPLPLTLMPAIAILQIALSALQHSITVKVSYE